MPQSPGNSAVINLAQTAEASHLTRRGVRDANNAVDLSYTAYGEPRHY